VPDLSKAADKEPVQRASLVPVALNRYPCAAA